MDNTAIARIALPDLGPDTLDLLSRFGDNDDVIFFLGRLVWQGEMTSSIPPLMTIALDATRGRYARIAAIRAVMSIGEANQKDGLWDTIAKQTGPLDRRLLGELLDGAAPDARSVDLLLATLEHLEPYERFEVTGLSEALRGFIDRLPIRTEGGQPLAQLFAGLDAFLDCAPYLERGECHVSEEFKWLLSPALQAVERLVAARAPEALAPAVIAVLHKVPVARFWRGSEDVSDYRTKLNTLVPRWRELNDTLYWTSVETRRAQLAPKGERLTDDWQFAFLGHFWDFGIEDFDRLVAWVADRPLLDDRLVALSRALVIFEKGDRPAAWRERLVAVTVGEAELEQALDARLNPKPSKAMEEMDAQHREWKRERELEAQENDRNRAEWVRALQAQPDRIRHPEGLKPGEFSGDQFHLLMSISEDGVTRDRDWGADWKSLVPAFGEAVAEAYRDAALAHWRPYQPKLRSEGADTGSTPYALIFAMAGLSIEAGEKADFPDGLSADDARHAFRYLTWQMNGFPRWFEALYRAHPAIGFAAVEKEVLWELAHASADIPSHHILHDILYHAPWLHSEVAPLLADWLAEHDMPNPDILRYSLAILAGGGTAAHTLGALAERKLTAGIPLAEQPRWFALWVDSDPDAAIPTLTAKLEELGEEASDFAQRFAVALLGDRRSKASWIGAFRTAPHLKALYILMHRFIRVKNDVDRMGKGAYSPTLRDDAQDARNGLFNLLSEVPGPESYAAIKALEKEHPEPDYRKWMARRARQRAIADADEPLWTVEQVQIFASQIAGTASS